MTLNKIFWIICGLVLLQVAQAEPYYCPLTYQYINLGDTLSAVQAKCGQPTKTETKRQQNQLMQPVEQWFYQLNTLAHTETAPPGSHLQMIVTIINRRITKIQLGGVTVGSASVCHDQGPFALGDTANKLRNHCGEPGFINKTQRTVKGKETRLNTILTYQFNPYQRVVLTFQNNRLIHIQR